MNQGGATSFKELVVWQKAHKFVLGIYSFTESFPAKETYGLMSQMRRAAVSVAANIAEGFKKKGKGDKIKYMNIAQGSLEECRYYIILSEDLHYGETKELAIVAEEISKLLYAYSNAIQIRDF
ncbi:MAG: four helix bundle protein [Bacteroidota bacterium]